MTTYDITGDVFDVACDVFLCTWFWLVKLGTNYSEIYDFGFFRHPTPHQKLSNSVFGPKKCELFWNVCKKEISDLIFNFRSIKFLFFQKIWAIFSQKKFGSIIFFAPIWMKLALTVKRGYKIVLANTILYPRFISISISRFYNITIL